MRHRLILTYHAEAEGIKPEDVIAQIVGKVKVP